MTSCPETRGWGFLVILKKSSELRFGPRGGQSSWAQRDEPCVCWVYELRLGRLESWPKDDVGTVSIVKIVSLSLRLEKLKVKKKVKGFVPELKKVVIISGLFVNILHIHIFYVFVFWLYNILETQQTVIKCSFTLLRRVIASYRLVKFRFSN